MTTPETTHRDFGELLQGTLEASAKSRIAVARSRMLLDQITLLLQGGRRHDE